MDDPGAPRALLLHGEKALAAPVRARLFSCCPTMDLVAVVCHEAQLDVYRFNGQRAFGFAPVNPNGHITSMSWKFNGQSIAVGWASGELHVVSSETGKVIQHFGPQFHAGDTSAVASLGWGLNFINTDPVREKITPKTEHKPVFHSKAGVSKENFGLVKDGADHTSLDDFLARLPDPKLMDMDQNLPDQLALLDVESNLPKLPVLAILPVAAGFKPSENLTAEAFATQASLDSTLHPHPSREANTADLLLKTTADGSTLPILYGSLPLRSLRFPRCFSNASPVLCSSHPFSCTYNILAETKFSSPAAGSGEKGRLVLLPVKIPFIRSSGKLLHIISSKTARLQNLMLYVSACLNSLNYHWRHLQDLPGRLMRVVKDTLAERDEIGLVESLFHLAATGHCPATIKEWLVEQLTERGHKRWDHAVSLGYSKILEITHESLLPGLDRFAALLSNLRGLASYHEDTGVFDIPPARFTVALEAIHCLRLLSHHILYLASRERTQFSAFSKWLRHEIAIQTSESDTLAEDSINQDIGLDHANALNYIRGPLVSSQTKPFLDFLGADAPAIKEVATPEQIVTQINILRQGKEPVGPFLSLKTHFSLLREICQDLFGRIVKWQTAGSTFDVALLFDEPTGCCCDMRTVSEGEEAAGSPDCVATFIVTGTARTQNQIIVYRILHHERLDDAKAIRSIGAHIIECGEYELRDVKFSDDETAIALLTAKDDSLLVSWPYRASQPGSDGNEQFHAVESSGFRVPDDDVVSIKVHRLNNTHATRTAWNLRDADDSRVRIMHSFAAEAHFDPQLIQVNGRKDRRVACVLGNDGKGYKIFDIDSLEGDTGDATLEHVVRDEDAVMSD